jgi:hypothetical protein
VKRVDADTVALNDVFTDFYKSEFIAAHEKSTGKKRAGLLESIAPFAAEDSPVRAARDYKSMGYDWSLNRTR